MACKICRTGKQKILQQGGGSGEEEEVADVVSHTRPLPDGGAGSSGTGFCSQIDMPVADRVAGRGFNLNNDGWGL